MQQMNVDQPETLTELNVAALLASKDDSQHRQLRVLDDGAVVLSDDVGNVNLNGVRARWETWCMANGYCGTKAASDAGWIAKVLHDLRRAGAEKRKGYLDY